MLGISEKEQRTGGHDFDLGIIGFRYSDLYDAAKLKELADRFYAEVAEKEPVLGDALNKYIAAHGLGYEKRVESKILTDAAPFLSDFVARMFGVSRERGELQNEILRQDPIWKYRFFVQRRAAKKFKPDELASLDKSLLDRALADLRNTAFDETLVDDDELAVAQITARLLDAEESLTKDPEPSISVRETVSKVTAAYEKLKDKPFGAIFAQNIIATDAEGDLLQIKAALGLLEAWSAVEFAKKEKRWAAFKTPHPLNYQNLVHLIHPEPELANVLSGTDAEMRRRDGFKLTDDRGTMRQALGEIDYCLICHERSKDSCSTWLRETDGSPKQNPLGIKTEGCPLDEKISEMHLLKGQGDSIGSLALITIDNPMCAGTGHRICNDCMKGCIFQKQEPVNIPLAETASLTDVLALPYGFEIYSLLTRWNPLNALRPHALPYNGKNVMVVGLGPAGYTLSQYLLNEGFGVIGIDGLKIEPLPAEWTGHLGSTCPKPIKDIDEITEELDERILSGFGGVSEYGITVRWDKNFLTMVQLLLSRRRRFRAYGGVRFGGTLTIEDAWHYGFDHIAIATGAGRPTIVPMKNNLIRGIRQASDFLMALQLTGAFKKDTLSNLQVRLPAVVIGGGLTGIDSATEIFAYYPVQREIIEAVSRFSRIPVRDIETGIDGCAAPNFAVPLAAMALSFLNLVSPPPEFDDVRDACGRIVSAMTKFPELIGGSERLDTILMQAADGKIISKVGTEGVWLCGVLPSAEYPNGLGIALKIEDGDDKRARPVAAVAILIELGILPSDALPELSPMPVKNRRGDVVGLVEAVPAN